MQNKWRLATQVIHAGHQKNEYGALASPLYQTATFCFDNAAQGAARFAGEEEGFVYTRLGNPTTAEFERKMARLEGCDAAAATASGMAAVSAALLANLSCGDHLVASHAVYGCTYSFMSNQLPRAGIEVTLVDFKDIEAIQKAIQPNTKVFFCETPVNPHLTVYDLTKIAQLAKANGLVSVVDNTFMTPLLQRPVELGHDIVLHSATKYLNGHGDVIAGVICGNTEQIEAIKLEMLKDFGGVLSPHDAWLILRGLKTLDVRMTRHCDNAQQLAEFLLTLKQVSRVFYPGLEQDAGYAYIGSQMQRAGGVIALELIGDFDDAVRFINRLNLISIAVSLGDAETLIQHPASMTHCAYTIEERKEAGISDTLLRISVGLECIDDIIEDIVQALA